jgi:hypothetical protein
MLRALQRSAKLAALTTGLIKRFPHLFWGTPGRQNIFHHLFSLTTWSLEH